MNPLLIQEIAAKVREAARDKKKIAMFHYQVLIHANELKGIDPVDFCREIGVPKTYSTEFGKMLSLAKLMEELGATISQA